MDEPTHIAGVDESSHTTGRYRSLCVVTCPAGDHAEISSRVTEVATGVSEIKWSKLKDKNQRRAATRAIDECLEFIQSGRMRVDALTWDTQDHRHALIGRDDQANLERMYYHLLGNALARRWGDRTVWLIRPDESNVDWSTLHDCLHSGVRKRLRGQPRSVTLEGAEQQHAFLVRQIDPQRSEDEALVQLADLFAGLTSWTAGHYSVYQRGRHEATGQQALCFDCEPEQAPLSNRDRYRCEVLTHLMARCRNAKLPISLETNRRLDTLHWKKCGLNFWFYEVQRAEDQAPRRGD